MSNHGETIIYTAWPVCLMLAIFAIVSQARSCNVSTAQAESAARIQESKTREVNTPSHEDMFC